MAIIIDNLVYDNEKVLFFFHNDIENTQQGDVTVTKQRTVSLSWGDLLPLNTIADVKAKLENIRLKMLFIGSLNGKKIKKERVINGLNYSV